MLCLSLSHEASIEWGTFINHTNKAWTGRQELGFANVRLVYFDTKVSHFDSSSVAQAMP